MFSSYRQIADLNLNQRQLEHILQVQWLGLIEKLLQKREVTFSGDAFAVVDVILA